jgi:predicted RNase H-like HicB family nuclease
MEFALAVHEERGKYGVTVPDLPGCFAAGDSFDEALADARGAIDAHVETLIEDGSGMPAVRSIAEHRKNPDYEDAIWGFVDVPVEKYFGPAEKINITVPAMVLKRIDEHATRHGESRSGFLVRAAEEAMRKAG